LEGEAAACLDRGRDWLHRVTRAPQPTIDHRKRLLDRRSEIAAQHVEGDDLDAISKNEFFAPREFLNRGEQSNQELIVRLDRCAGPLGIIAHGKHLAEKHVRGLRPWTPRGKEVKI
jgi:hypothetical protein